MNSSGIIILVVIVFLIVFYAAMTRRKKVSQETADNIMVHAIDLEVDDILHQEDGQDVTKISERANDGVYVLYDTVSNRFLAEASKSCWQDAKKHLTGEGNRELYTDLQSGHYFQVLFLPLYSSSSRSAEGLRAQVKQVYLSYSKPYK